MLRPNLSQGSSLLLGLSLMSAVSAELWVCHNDYEARCSELGCAVYQQDDFTPASVLLSSEGELEICLYTGCWQGQGQVLAQAPYLVIQGNKLDWNSPFKVDQQDALLSLERSSNIATMQVAGFQLSLLCH
ncbi:hypothetical protein [Agarivorans gilvus]|uniref:Uncharacterized protein n=1 Tax=Agarivorans gilvus TaxID=680279 RepID=A0ABQ1I5T0_9ALTE|nr:hypothetical protein [Agarivorans gilvus]GGB14150.1 hypothetical protein GCM10007414_29450 [Agarivorans gilvus]